MQKFILPLSIFISSFFVLNCFSQPSEEPDSISWAYEKISQGKQNESDTTFAITCFEQALMIGKKVNNNLLMERAFYRLGYQYSLAGLRKKTLYYCRKAIEQKKLHSEKSNIFTMFYLIAQMNYLNGDYSSALDSLTKAEGYAKANNDNGQLLLSYTQRIAIYSYLGQVDLAQRLLQKAIKLSLLEKNRPYLHNFYGRKADLEKRRNHYIQALKYYKKSITIIDNFKSSDLQKLKSYNYNQIGDIYFKLKKFQLAKHYYLLALENSNSKGSEYYASITLVDLAKLETELGHFDRAFNYIKQLDSVGKIEKNSLLIMRFLQVGNLYNKLNQLDSALYYYKKAIKITEKRKAQVDISRFRVALNNRDFILHLKVGHIYKSLYYSSENISLFDSLFKYVNNYRSRSLFENNESKVAINETPYAQAIRKVEKIYKDVRFLKHNNNSKIIEELEQVKYNLVSKRVELLKEKAPDFKEISRADFQKYLAKNNSCAVIYTINEQGQFALYLDEHDFKVIELNILPENLQGNIKQLLSSAFYKKEIKNFEYNTILAHKLYLSLWKPLEEKINLPQNVIIIPDHNVLNLPFDILLNEETDKPTYSVSDKPAYLKNLLIQKYNFSYLPSANLVKAFKTPNENENVLLVANPEFNVEYKIKQEIINHTGWTFEPLIYSYAEVQSIKKLFKKTLVFKGENAAKSQFRDYLRSSKIIHFATHAFVDTVFDLFSGLVLSAPKNSTDNGFLLGYEIDQLNLNCDLVTLSACESGRGRIVSAEGVMGLPRLFFGAGARSVLMTLWKIDDMQSSTLMSLFYENIARKQFSKIEALGEAKRSFISNDNFQNGVYYSYPFFWAAFNLYGDGGEITIVNEKFSTSLLITTSFFVLASLLFFINYIKRKF